LKPIFANVSARADAAGHAAALVARVMQKSGVAADDMSREMVQAAREGQPEFMVADAIGAPGQRMLASHAQGPGDESGEIVNTLQARQADQGRRVVNTLTEGFEPPALAETSPPMAVEAGRRAATDSANEDTISAFRGLTPEEQHGFRAGYVDPKIAQVEAALLAANKAQPFTTDAFRSEARAIAPRGPLEVFPINESQSEARLRSAYPHIVSVDAAALRDVVERQIQRPLIWKNAKANAVRQANGAEGYPLVDVEDDRTRIADGQHRTAVAAERGQRIGVAVRTPEAARTLQDMVGGAPELADRMLRKFGRENTMFDTAAMVPGVVTDVAGSGGPRVDPALIGQILSGDWRGALQTARVAGQNAAIGNTPEVRRQVAKILLQNGTNLSPARFAETVDRTVARIQFLQNLVRVAVPVARGGFTEGVVENRGRP
jgi:hypothetical protein